MIVACTASSAIFDGNRREGEGLRGVTELQLEWAVGVHTNRFESGLPLADRLRPNVSTPNAENEEVITGARKEFCVGKTINIVEPRHFDFSSVHGERERSQV